MNSSSKNKSKSASALICFLPLVLFIIVELIYDSKFFFKHLVNKFIPQYATILGISLITFLYILFTINNDDILLSKDKDKDKDNKSSINQLTNDSKKKVEEVILFGVLTFLGVLVGTIIYSTLTKNKIKGISVFFIYSVISLCVMSFTYERVRIFNQDTSNDEQEQKISMLEFLGKGIGVNNNIEIYQTANLKTILPGLVFGLVFGFIDNAGLISGLEALDSPFGVIARKVTGFIPNKKGGGDLVAKEMMEGTTAGLGNLFSDGLGVSLGAFFGKVASSIFPSEIQQPLWVDMVGISIGCILGIAIPISVKNLTNGNMWAKGFFSFRFIKDFLIISILFGAIIASTILLPKQAKNQLNNEINENTKKTQNTKKQ